MNAKSPFGDTPFGDIHSGDMPTDWDDAEETVNHEADFYDELAHLYLVSGEVWPDGMTIDNLPKLEASLRLSDFFEDLSPELEK